VRSRLAAIGFLSMLGQVALLREAAVASFGIELVYLLGLGLWLAAGAAGALAGRRVRGPRDADAAHGIDRGFLLLAFFLLAELVFLRGSRVLLGGVPGAYLPLDRQAAAIVLGMVPAGAVLGWLFARSARAAAEKGTSLASAYAVESAGGAAGSVAATLSLAWGAPNLALVLICTLGSASVAVFSRRPRRMALAAVLMAVSALVLVFIEGPLERLTASWNHPGLAAAADTPHGRVTVTRAGGQTAVFVNDALSFESEGVEAERFVHLAALQIRSGARVLVLGGAASGVVEELLRHSPARVDCVEGDRAMLRAVLPHLPGRTRGALADGRVRLMFDDPRRFLAASGERGGGTYGLILVAVPGPSSGESNRFYTREFFRLCTEKLAPGGVVALRLASAENLWTPLLLQRNAAVHAALAEAFTDVLVIPGGNDVLLGSLAALVRDPGELARRLEERGIAARLVTAPWLRYSLTNDRVDQAARRLAEARVPPNTDARPACYRQAALLWLGMFLPVTPDAGTGDRSGALVVLVAAAAILAISRFRAGWRRAALAATAGFTGMGIESLVLLRFQAETGSLYRDIGLLLTSFMAGLAAGAWAFNRLADGRRKAPRWWGLALLLALSALAGGLALSAEGGGFLFRQGPAAALLALCGMLTAGLFGYASRMGTQGQGDIASPLYAADLMGGCLGALLAGFWLLPLLGAEATAAGVSLLALAALATI
jgi:spermidine synthase